MRLTTAKPSITRNLKRLKIIQTGIKEIISEDFTMTIRQQITNKAETIKKLADIQDNPLSQKDKPIGTPKKRTISITDIENILPRLEQILNDYLFVKDWTGVTFSINLNPNKTGRTINTFPDATFFEITRKTMGWSVQNIHRKPALSYEIKWINAHKFTEKMADCVTKKDLKLIKD